MRIWKVYGLPQSFPDRKLPCNDVQRRNHHKCIVIARNEAIHYKRWEYEKFMDCHVLLSVVLAMTKKRGVMACLKEVTKGNPLKDLLEEETCGNLIENNNSLLDCFTIVRNDRKVDCHILLPIVFAMTGKWITSSYSLFSQL